MLPHDGEVGRHDPVDRQLLQLADLRLASAPSFFSSSRGDARGLVALDQLDAWRRSR